jgi:hypothetical protein
LNDRAFAWNEQTQRQMGSLPDVPQVVENTGTV